MEYYLEYEILHDRPGLLGDVASLIGMLKINIEKISSIEGRKRGFLLNYVRGRQIEVLIQSLQAMDDLRLTHHHTPDEFDLLTLKHGKRLHCVGSDLSRPQVYRFKRKELDYLIDFLCGRLERETDLLIGLRGSPRIGKTETAIAASVQANKPWLLISSTLFRTVTRTSIDEEDVKEKNPVFILDAITTFQRSFPAHMAFAQSILQRKALRIVEHPDVLVWETDWRLTDFDLIVELYFSDEEELYGVGHDHYGFNHYDIS